MKVQNYAGNPTKTGRLVSDGSSYLVAHFLPESTWVIVSAQDCHLRLTQREPD
jgi:hypothetical protein